MRALTIPATAFLACLLAAVAGAQEAVPSPPILFSADELQNDEELGLIVARGHVQISQGARTLLADTVTYNQKTDTATASGHVSLLEPTGVVLSGDFIELTDRFENGFIKDIRVLLTDRSRMAGNTGRRSGSNRLELRRGVYSPCDLCRDDPSRPPLWQIRAESVVHDQQSHIVEYRDAVLEVGGVPIFYTPYLSHPDPSVKRQSGFLIPTVGSSSNLGGHTTIPYYWAIGPDRDATFSPIITTRAGFVAAGEYRQRYSDGELRTSGSLNNGTSPDDPSRDKLRGHVFAHGRWDLDETWRTGFDLRRSTDQTYLRRFNFGGTENFLTSSSFAEAFRPRSYVGINAYAFQALRQGADDSRQPIVLPAASYSWIGDPDAHGARWNVDANLLDLSRFHGTSSRRLSLGTGWTLPFRGPIGDLYTVSATTRGDAYYATDVTAGPGDPTRDGLAGRIFPQAALQWRYPWVRRGQGYSQSIEPVVAFIAAPNGGNPARIPNEDSLAFDFNETDLFVPDRFPGLDRVDGGQRVDYGIRAAIYGDQGGSSKLVLGESYRLQRNAGFPVGSGLEERRSDIVGRVEVSPSRFFSADYRFRLAKEDFRARRQEVTFSGGPDSLRLAVSYLMLPPDLLSADTGRRDQASFGVSADLSRYWRMSLATTQNLTGDLGTVSSGVTLAYRDECLSFITSLSRSGTRDRDVRPGTALLFTLVFKNLGEITAPAFSTTGLN